MARAAYDAVIVGAGPNGLAAAIALGRAGLSTLVVEAKDTPGGGCRSGPLMVPDLVHDHCSTVHPLGAASPFFRSLALERHGLAWIESPSPLAHVLADGTAVTLERSIDATAAQLGPDGPWYRRLVSPFTARFAELVEMALGPLRFPSSPLLYARFGLQALRSQRGLERDWFEDPRAGALLAGIAAHAMLPLGAMGTATFGLILACAGHAVGWPIARGGSGAITRALVACLRELGGELALDWEVDDLASLPRARAYLLDLTPRQVLAVTGDRLPDGYRRRLARFRYGPGVYKMDWVLSSPIPWRDPRCARAATVHLAGNSEDVAAAEAAVHRGGVSERPFVLLVQPTLFDPSRAPSGTHIAWAYCHVPHGSAVDAADAIEGQIERYAPGFRDTIVARAHRNARAMERYNPNYVGGDINGGIADLRQLFFRPVVRSDPYSTPARDVFICSSSTPPGGGVHGMCGYWAARSALARVFRADDVSRRRRPRRPSSPAAPSRDPGAPGAWA